MGFGFKQPLVGEKRCVTTLITAAKETIKIGGPWTRSMKGVHGPGPYFDGPGPQRGSMDQGSMFCTFPVYINNLLINKLYYEGIVP